MPCRPGSPGVLDLRHLNRKLLQRNDTHMSGDGVVDSAEFALEAIRFPYRQVFGDTAHPVEQMHDVFRPTVFIAPQPQEKTVALTGGSGRGWHDDADARPRRHQGGDGQPALVRVGASRRHGPRTSGSGIPRLLRETRVLVPIDVQALYVDPTNIAAHVSPAVRR